MRNKKILIYLSIILMIVGFAAVSTTLFINGTSVIGTSDFLVYFSDAIIDGDDVSNVVINANKDKITYTTSELSSLNDESVLDFKVANNSTQYDANVSINCEIEDNDFVSIRSSLANSVIAARSKESGQVVVKLIKVTDKEQSFDITCEISASAVERTTPITSEIKENSYTFSGYLLDENNNAIPNANLVVYSETPHYTTTNEFGYFLISNLEKGTHEFYYVNEEMDALKSKSKTEISEASVMKVEFTTNEKNTRIDSSNGIYINEISIDDDSSVIVTLNKYFYDTIDLTTLDYSLIGDVSYEDLSYLVSNGFVIKNGKALVSAVGSNLIALKYNNEKYYIKVISTWPEADIYISATSTATDPDGSVDKPYKTIKDGITAAKDNDKVYVMPGEYDSVMDVDSYAKVGLNDLGKKLEIFGANELSVIIHDAHSHSNRDASMFGTTNSGTIVRNLTFIYKPKRNCNYSDSIFRWAYGEYRNIYLYVAGTSNASYAYNNAHSNSFSVYNSTIYFKSGVITSNYSGSGIFYNVATNVAGGGTLNNTTSVSSFEANNDDYIDTLALSYGNENFVNNSRGVFYGDYAWSK